MIVNDRQIRKLCEKDPPLITPYDSVLVNPASIDIRMGNTVQVDNWGANEPFRIDNLDDKTPMLICPGESMLIATLEAFDIPNHFAGMIKLKSSAARAGLALAGAEWFDPGFRGIATLSIRNVSRHHRIPVFPGKKFAQLILFHMAEPPQRDYKQTGRYNNCDGVQGSLDQAVG